MIVEKCAPADLDQAIVNALRDYSLYSSPDFARLWKAHGGRPVCWICRRGHEITGVLPGVEFGRGPLARLQIMPDGLYARVVTVGSDVTARQASIIALTLALKSERYAKLYLADFYAEFNQMDGFDQADCEAVVLDLSKPEWEPPDATLRSEIRKAEREGIQVKPFDFERHFGGFVRLMEATESRHGRRPKYSREFYAALAQLALKDDRVQWTVVEHESGLACSHIYLVDRDSALYWQAFFDKEFSFLKPNQLMLYSMAKSLRAGGIKELCLGASPVDAAGLRAFKEKWGGSARSYAIYTRKSLWGRIL